MIFSSYLLLIESQELDNNIKKVIQFTKYIPKNLDLIRKAITDKKIKDLSYIYYLFGFAKNKQEARIEDFHWAIDTYNKYTRFKARLPEFKLNPFELGQKDVELKAALNQLTASNTQQKRIGKLAKEGQGLSEKRLIKETFGDYTFYTIPAAKNQQEELENKSMYCTYGKGTGWCTAEPSGTYYLDYVKQLDITIIYKNNKPLYQFGLGTDGRIIDHLSQFMDSNDHEIKYLEKDLIPVIDNNTKFESILRLPQFNKMNQILKYDLTKKGEQKRAIEENEYAIYYIDKPSTEIQLFLVVKRPSLFKLIDNPDESAKIKAVQLDAYNIEYVKDPSEKVQEEAVKRDGRMIQFIKSPSENVQKLAVNQHAYMIKFLKNPSEEVVATAINKNPDVIKELNNPSEKIQEIAVSKDGTAIQWIPNPSLEIQKSAVQQNGLAISYIKNPSEEVQLLAVKQNRLAFHSIKNPTHELEKQVFGMK